MSIISSKLVGREIAGGYRVVQVGKIEKGGRKGYLWYPGFSFCNKGRLEYPWLIWSDVCKEAKKRDVHIPQQKPVSKCVLWCNNSCLGCYLDQKEEN